MSPAPPDQCALRVGPPEGIETLTVALLEPVTLAHAPIPDNDSERLLFRYLHDTLVRLDCEGRARPGLAASWSPDSAARTWTFTLSDEARLPTGAAMKALDVVSAWQARPAMTATMGIQSAAAVNERTLAVTLSQWVDSAPTLFADPALAILVRNADSLSAVRFQMVGNGDPRDALDRGAGLVVTRDPTLVEYAGSKPDLKTFALPWSRTYILLQPAGAVPVQGITGADSLRRSLARDAVRAVARPAEPPFWWDGAAACTMTDSRQDIQSAGARVVYAAGDEVARGLAQRIVALAGTATPLRAAALEDADFALSLRTGSERAYVVATPRVSSAPCREAAAWPAGASVQPLIDTQAQAIVRRGFPGLEVEWDGSVRVLEPADSGAAGS